MIDDELQRSVARLNGDNNKKELGKLSNEIAKEAWMQTYNSTARNLVRMWWLTKFLTKLLDNLINQADMTLVNACRDAYQVGFSEHHPWIVRKGAGMAMGYAGEKKKLIQSWGVQSVEEARPTLEYFTKLRDDLDALLT